MRTSKRQGVADASARKTVRVNVRLEAEAQKRLAVHCAMTGMSPGEVLTRLCEGLREFSMPARLADRADKSHRINSVLCERDSPPAPALQDAA
jgi:hypothetical protein